MQADVDMMERYLKKYGTRVMTSVYHLREALLFIAEKPEIILQSTFVDILNRHEGKEEYVMRMIKILSPVRDDLRNFYIPAWLSKLNQKMVAIVNERLALEERKADIMFDAFEWAFTADVTRPDGGYIYR
ncbi:unnamed protein product, partial [Discosporangium mesarthrocarpum]